VIVAFLGDVHGHVFHSLGVLVRWQQEHRRRLDLIVQVGDLGVWPDPARADRATRRFALTDPGEFDFSRLFHLGEDQAVVPSEARKRLGGPIWFIRGNHEDDAWLQQLEQKGTPPLLADPLGLYRYVPDGSVRQVGGCAFGFAGGADLSDEAFDRLLAAPELDVLVTHNGPWGLSKGRRGDVQGSERIRELVERIQPRYHVFGHLHHMIGPERVGETVCIGLDQLVAPVRAQASQVICPGGLGLLDTALDKFHFVRDDWLAEFGREFGVSGLAAAL
jgi:hypothetical protein